MGRVLEYTMKMVFVIRVNFLDEQAILCKSSLYDCDIYG
jgi:hypothetical protein